ncbi:MAG: hypothetical protein IPP76_10570 [Moraxellaceae bacterium]|nr:hypothetical protein [Moraxellaceae bacterium]
MDYFLQTIKISKNKLRFWQGIFDVLQACDLAMRHCHTANAFKELI